MEHIHPAHHSWLVHEWEVVHSPGNTTNLGVDLNENLVDNRSEVLAFCDGVAQHDLRGDWELSQEESLNVIVQLTLAFLAWQQKNDSLNVRVNLGLQLFDPVVSLLGIALDYEDIRLSTLIAKLLQNLFHCRGKLLSNLGVSVTVEDPPGLQGWLVEHLVLNLSVDVSC